MTGISVIWFSILSARDHVLGLIYLTPCGNYGMNLA